MEIASAMIYKIVRPVHCAYTCSEPDNKQSYSKKQVVILNLAGHLVLQNIINHNIDSHSALFISIIILILILFHFYCNFPNMCIQTL